MFMLNVSWLWFPLLWKTSCLIPVPKTPRPRGPQHYRPMALTSHIMKTLERLLGHVCTPFSLLTSPASELRMPSYTCYPTSIHPLSFSIDPLHHRHQSLNGPSCHVYKFSDDSALVGFISGGNEYPAVVDSFVTWCEQNHLQLHVTETKELIGDFKRTRKPATPCFRWSVWT